MNGPGEIELERSPQARLLAERALVALLHELGEEEVEMVVLGGLVPEILTRGQDPPAPVHLGTTDVDVLLVTQVTVDAYLGSVESALREIGFGPDGCGWRWRGRIEGRSVKIEFLCDLETGREFEYVTLNGCTDLVAWNLRGTGYVTQDWAAETITAQLADGRTVSVEARFARLGGYLLSKCVAARSRGAEKDFYDLAYVLLHNRSGGPHQAAEALLDGTLNSAVSGLRSTLIEVRERYAGPSAVGPSGYASQALLVSPELNEAELRADAVAAVREFLEPLLRVERVSS